jgi:hypothetical protein
MAQAAVATPGQRQRRREAKVKVTGSGPKNAARLGGRPCTRVTNRVAGGDGSRGLRGERNGGETWNPVGIERRTDGRTNRVKRKLTAYKVQEIRRKG